AYALRWEVAALAWLTLLGVAMVHEFAHGLTCKHHGGEVHEIGFLLLFLMPCFYCNVSDAWLIREKSKRLGVTLAGAYCDQWLWAHAGPAGAGVAGLLSLVLAWRLARGFPAGTRRVVVIRRRQPVAGGPGPVGQPGSIE